MNPNNNNKNWTNPKIVLDHLNKLYIYITKRLEYKHKITKQTINNNTLMSFYSAFNLGYSWLISNNLISGDSKKDLIAKKKALDELFITNKGKKLNSPKNVPNINGLASNLQSLKLN
jgi:hypothetical protein